MLWYDDVFLFLLCTVDESAYETAADEIVEFESSLAEVLVDCYPDDPDGLIHSQFACRT